MSWQVLVTVFTFGGIGAVVRAIVIMILQSSAKIFPLSILLVNILAAFLGGFIISMSLPEQFTAILLVGLVGGIGTLSSINANILDFFFDRAWRRLSLYLGLTVILGIFAAFAGQSFGNMFHDMVVQKSQYQLKALESMTQGLHDEAGHNLQLQLPEDPKALEQALRAELEQQTKASSDQSKTETSEK